MEIPDFVLDLAQRRAYAGGEEVSLTDTQWHVLEILAGHLGDPSVRADCPKGRGGPAPGSPAP